MSIVIGATVPLTRLPSRANFGGFLYIVSFDNGITKVGRTADPQGRIRAHEQAGRRFGVRRVSVWVSRLHDDCVRTESELIAVARRLSVSHDGREYFTGLSFSDLVNAADELQLPPVDIAAHEARAAAIVPLFGTIAQAASSAATDPLADIAARIADLFRSAFAPDGGSTSAEETVATMRRIADLRGETLASVLALTPVEMLAETVATLAHVEANRMAEWAHTHRRLDVITPYASQIQSCPVCGLFECAWRSTACPLIASHGSLEPSTDLASASPRS